MRTLRAVIAAGIAHLASGPAWSDTCCVDRACQVVDATSCAAAGGIAGYCRAGEECGADPCLAGLGGRDLMGVKDGNDVVFVLESSPAASRYYTHYSMVREGQPCPSCPGSAAVPGCAPATIPEALHAGAVSGSGGELLLYAARAACGAVGACCIALGCIDGLDAPSCQSQSGAYQGEATTCDSGPFCAAFRYGACCLSETSCFEADPASCAVQGEYLGDGTSCLTATCAGTWGACCTAGGVCVYTWAGDCGRRPGVFHAGETCPFPC